MWLNLTFIRDTFFSTLILLLTLTCTINDLAHQLQIAISSWEMLRFLLPIQSFIVLMGFVSLLVIPGHKSCKKVVLVNSYLAPRQKKDKLSVVSEILVFNVYVLTILKVFHFTLSRKNSFWLAEQFMKIWNSKFVRPFGEQVILQKLFVQKLFLSNCR